jgi:hypothetical protein
MIQSLRLTKMKDFENNRQRLAEPSDLILRHCSMNLKVLNYQMAPRLSRMNLRKLRRDFDVDYFLGDNFESYFVNEMMETVLKERRAYSVI